MKRLIIITVLILFALPAFAGERVRGHWKDTNRDGVKDTYVEPYYRSERNNSTLDNYSTKGNVNPYTGKEGTKDTYNDNSYSNPFGNSSKQKSYDYDSPFKKHKSPFDD